MWSETSWATFWELPLAGRQVDHFGGFAAPG